MHEVETAIGYQFKEPNLLLQAFTHKSFTNEQLAKSTGDNERLEFLGDAVLNLVLSDYLMRVFPERSEGDLSKIRAGLVNEGILSQIAHDFGFNKWLRLGKGEMATRGSEKPRLLASVFEAFIGAFYLDAGFQAVHNFTVRVFAPRLSQTDPKQHFSTDYKTRLQEAIQERYRQVPSYEVIKEEGPDHSKTFFVEVKALGRVLGSGTGRSKKQAEQIAAKFALEEFS